MSKNGRPRSSHSGQPRMRSKAGLTLFQVPSSIEAVASMSTDSSKKRRKPVAAPPLWVLSSITIGSNGFRASARKAGRRAD